MPEVLLIVSVLLLGVLAALLIPAYTKPILDRRGNPVPGSIASLEQITLGGVQQWILIRGVNTANPILLFLHGGPGTSEMGLVRNYNSALEKHFTVVLWDQRGAGKSYAALHPQSEMTIEQFIADTHELSSLLCERFQRQKIFLAGHSWGSALGVLTVQRYPELFIAYAGIGQVVHLEEGERISYDWTLKQAAKANDGRSIRRLREMGPPPYTGNWQSKTIAQRALLGRYGGEVYGNPRGGFFIILRSLLKTTEFTWADRVNFFRGIFASMRAIWRQLLPIDLREVAPELQVPVFFLEGRHDYEAPSVLAEQYYQVLKAPEKKIVWFENSAHFLNVEEASKFNEFLIEQFLPLAADRRMGSEPSEKKIPSFSV